jgi:hypothetical protein
LSMHQQQRDLTPLQVILTLLEFWRQYNLNDWVIYYIQTIHNLFIF